MTLHSPAAGPARDPARALADVLIALDAERRTQSRALRETEHNRIGLLIVHAIVALLVPPLFVMSDFVGPTWRYVIQVPGFPYSWVLPLWIGGIILLPAAIARRQLWEMTGLALIYVWYMATGLGFGYPVAVWAVEAFSAWNAGRPGPPAKPSLYPCVIYFHLAVIMRIHFMTLLRFRRGDRDERRRSEDRELLLGDPR